MKYYRMHMKHQKWHTKYFTAFLGSEIERLGPFACAGYVSLCQSTLLLFQYKIKINPVSTIPSDVPIVQIVWLCLTGCSGCWSSL